MPSSTDDLKLKMCKWFGDMDLIGPQAFLEAHGYVLNRKYGWDKPTPSHTVSEYEADCLEFLIEEWDYGGIER